jgi:hypothetical protein
MKDKDHKMLIEAYAKISNQKKIVLKESSSYTYYYAGEEEGTELPIEIKGKHYKYYAEFSIEASDWTADDYEEYGYNGPQVAMYKSKGSAYPETLELKDVESVGILDENGKLVFEYHNTNNPQRQGVNHLGIDPQEVIQTVFYNFKKVLETDENVIHKITNNAKPPEWEP